MTIVTTMSNGDKPKATPLTSGIRQRYPLSPFLSNTALEVLARTLRQEKEIKGIQIRMEFADDMILHMSVEYLYQETSSTDKHFEQSSKFQK